MSHRISKLDKNRLATALYFFDNTHLVARLWVVPADYEYPILYYGSLPYTMNITSLTCLSHPGFICEEIESQDNLFKAIEPRKLKSWNWIWLCAIFRNVAAFHDFFKILFLSHFYTQHGAWTYDPEIKSHTCFTEAARHPCFVTFNNAEFLKKKKTDFSESLICEIDLGSSSDSTSCQLCALGWDTPFLTLLSTKFWITILFYFRGLWGGLTEIIHREIPDRQLVE